VPEQQPVTPVLFGTDGAAAVSNEQAWRLWNCLGHCPAWSPLPTDCDSAGRFYSPALFSSSFTPTPLAYLALPFQVLVFLHSLPSRSLSLQPLNRASSVSPTSLPLPLPTLPPVPLSPLSSATPLLQLPQPLCTARANLLPHAGPATAAWRGPGVTQRPQGWSRPSWLVFISRINRDGGQGSPWHGSWPGGDTLGFLILPCKGCKEHIPQWCPVFDLIMQSALYRGFFKAT